MTDVRRALWLSAESHVIDGVRRPNPPGVFELPAPALFAQMISMVSGAGTVLIDKTAATLIGLPSGELPTGPDAKGHPVATALRAGGYTCREIYRWFTVKHDAGQIEVALAEFLDIDHFPLLEEDNPEAMTKALAQWHALGGTPWTGGAGDAGNAILRKTRYRLAGKDVPAKWWSRDMQPTGRPIEYPYLPESWQRPAPAGTKVAASMDRVRAYLSAMTCTKVAAEHLAHDVRTTFDRKRSGWWLVELVQWDLYHLMPDPVGYTGGQEIYANGGGRLRWLTTPTVELLDDLRRDGLYDFAIRDSWTAPSTDIMITYAKTLRAMWDGTASIDDPLVRELVRAGVKGAYQLGHGYMRSGQSTVQRLDWAAAVTAVSRCNLWRRLWAIGQAGGTFAGPWPLIIDTDNVWYPDALPIDDALTIWDGNRPDLDDVTKLGHWRTSGTVPVNPETGWIIRPDEQEGKS